MLRPCASVLLLAFGVPAAAVPPRSCCCRKVRNRIAPTAAPDYRASPAQAWPVRPSPSDIRISLGGPENPLAGPPGPILPAAALPPPAKRAGTPGSSSSQGGPAPGGQPSPPSPRAFPGPSPGGSPESPDLLQGRTPAGPKAPPPAARRYARPGDGGPGASPRVPVAALPIRPLDAGAFDPASLPSLANGTAHEIFLIQALPSEATPRPNLEVIFLDASGKPTARQHLPPEGSRAFLIPPRSRVALRAEGNVPFLDFECQSMASPALGSLRVPFATGGKPAFRHVWQAGDWLPGTANPD